MCYADQPIESNTLESDRSYPNWWGSCSCCICWKSSLLASCSLWHLGPDQSRYSTVPPRTSSIFSLCQSWRSYSRAFEFAKHGITLLLRHLIISLQRSPSHCSGIFHCWGENFRDREYRSMMRETRSAPIAVVATYVPFLAARNAVTVW